MAFFTPLLLLSVLLSAACSTHASAIIPRDVQAPASAAAVIPVASIHLHDASATAVTVEDRQAFITTILAKRDGEYMPTLEPLVQEVDLAAQEEENMGYFREFKNFFSEAKGAKFDKDFPVRPSMTTPAPYMTLVGRSMPGSEPETVYIPFPTPSVGDG
jgi:hypothetical protein